MTTVATTDLTDITDLTAITDPTLHDDPAALGERTASAVCCRHPSPAGPRHSGVGLTGVQGVHPFDGMTHGQMATLAREYLLAGHMIDRAGMPHLIGPWGREVMTEVAIDEWMGASPVYTRRMQLALGFTGTDVATMFKGMQLDVGAPPEFLDFRYTVHDADHGEFRLDHCGALMDVEPMGDDFVLAMCHTIEDPTFEATACASNPQARMAPVHRPPRSPAERHPHCHWTITIDHDAEPLAMPATAHHIASSLAASVVVEAVGTDTGDHWGRSDYTGDLDPDLRMEDFSSLALSVIAQEACVQAHLLVLSFQAAIAARYGTDAATDVCRRQFTGAAGLVAGRLVRAFGLQPGADGLARLLSLHPAFDRCRMWTGASPSPTVWCGRPLGHVTPWPKLPGPPGWGCWSTATPTRWPPSPANSTTVPT